MAGIKILQSIRILRTTYFQRNIVSSSIKCMDETPKPNLKSLLDNAASYGEKDPTSDKWVTPVYPEKRLQSSKAIRLQVDPKETSVILFPGQGSQYVGMAKSLLGYPNVKEMFDCASEILRYDLLDLCLNGPEDMLNMTVHSQVAVVVASLAAVEKLRAEAEKMIERCASTAGFSVGEYAALVFAGALEFEKAIRLLKVRGEAMQAASDLEPGGMMTVFLSPSAKIRQACLQAREWCEKHDIYNADCRVAIYMFPDCRVVSGHVKALNYIEENAKELGIRKIKHIPVSGAFHSNLMKPVKPILAKALHATHFEMPLIPVHSNIGGAPYSTVEQIRKSLADQPCKPVEWEQLLHIMFEREQGRDFPHVYECGPGTTLKTLLRFNNQPASQQCLNVLA